MLRPVSVLGCGGYVPERIVTNDDLARYLETSDEWIRTRTGIAQRHIAAANQARVEADLGKSQKRGSSACC